MPEGFIGFSVIKTTICEKEALVVGQLTICYHLAITAGVVNSNPSPKVYLNNKIQLRITQTYLYCRKEGKNPIVTSCLWKENHRTLCRI